MTLNRRDALKYGLSAAAVAAVGLVYRLSSDRRRSTDIFDELAEVSGLCTVGRTYLQRFPEEADESTLIALLLAGGSKGLDLRGGSTTEVRQRIRQDFVEDDVVTVDGWILSRTEARLYAGAALRDGICMPVDVSHWGRRLYWTARGRLRSIFW